MMPKKTQRPKSKSVINVFQPIDIPDLLIVHNVEKGKRRPQTHNSPRNQRTGQPRAEPRKRPR